MFRDDFIAWVKNHEAYKITTPVADPHRWGRWLQDYGTEAIKVADRADAALTRKDELLREALESMLRVAGTAAVQPGSLAARIEEELKT